MYGLFYECKFLTIEETNKNKKKLKLNTSKHPFLYNICLLLFCDFSNLLLIDTNKKHKHK
jgi:hypothetical protein